MEAEVPEPSDWAHFPLTDVQGACWLQQEGGSPPEPLLLLDARPQGEVSAALATLQSAYPYFMVEEAEAGEGGASAQVNS